MSQHFYNQDFNHYPQSNPYSNPYTWGPNAGHSDPSVTANNRQNNRVPDRFRVPCSQFQKTYNEERVKKLKQIDSCANGGPNDMDMTLRSAEEWPGRQAVDEIVQNCIDGAFRTAEWLASKEDCFGYIGNSCRWDYSQETENILLEELKRRVRCEEFHIPGITRSLDENGSRTIFYGLVGQQLKPYRVSKGSYNDYCFEVKNNSEHLLGFMIVETMTKTESRIVQNYDGSTRGENHKVEYISNVRAVNYGAQLNPYCLTAGASGKEKEQYHKKSQYKGRFGDGLRGAIKFFERIVHSEWGKKQARAFIPSLDIKTCGYQYVFSMQKKAYDRFNDSSEDRTLHFELQQISVRSNIDSEFQNEIETALRGKNLRPNPHRNQSEKVNNMSDWKASGNFSTNFDINEDIDVSISNLENLPEQSDRLSLESFQNRYLFLNRDYKKICLRLQNHKWKSQREILLGEKFADRIYVKGMVTMEGFHKEKQYGDIICKKHLFGYNFLEYAVKRRDRLNSIGDFDLRKEILFALHDNLKRCAGISDSKVLTGYEDQSQQKERNLLLKLLFEGMCDDPTCQEVSILEAGIEGHAAEIRKLLWEQHFQKAYIQYGRKPAAYIYGNDQMRRKIEYINRHPVPLPPKIYEMFAPYMANLDHELEKKTIDDMFDPNVCKPIRVDFDDVRRPEAILERVFISVLDEWLRKLPEFKEWAKCRSNSNNYYYRNSELPVNIQLVEAPDTKKFTNRICAIKALPIQKFRITGFESDKLNGEYYTMSAQDSSAPYLHGYPIFWKDKTGDFEYDKVAPFLHRTKDGKWALTPKNQYKSVSAGKEEHFLAKLETGNFWDGADSQESVLDENDTRNRYGRFGTAKVSQRWQEGSAQREITVTPIVRKKDVRVLLEATGLTYEACEVAINIRSLKRSLGANNDVCTALMFCVVGVQKEIVETLRSSKLAWRVDNVDSDELLKNLMQKIQLELGMQQTKNVDIITETNDNFVLDSAQEHFVASDDSEEANGVIDDAATQLLDSSKAAYDNVSQEAELQEFQSNQPSIAEQEANETDVENNGDTTAKSRDSTNDEFETNMSEENNEITANTTNNAEAITVSHRNGGYEDERALAVDDQQNRDYIQDRNDNGQDECHRNSPQEQNAAFGHVHKTVSFDSSRNLAQQFADADRSSHSDHQKFYDDAYTAGKRSQSEIFSTASDEKWNKSSELTRSNTTLSATSSKSKVSNSSDLNRDYSAASSNLSRTNTKASDSLTRTDTTNLSCYNIAVSRQTDKSTNDALFAFAKEVTKTFFSAAKNDGSSKSNASSLSDKECRTMVNDFQEQLHKKIRQRCQSLLNMSDIGPQYAWRGDRALDYYLAREVVNTPPPLLKVSFADGIRQKLFSCRALGNGCRNLSEKKEEEIGEMMTEYKDDFDAVMSMMKIPDPDCPERTEKSVEELVKRNLVEKLKEQVETDATAGLEKLNRFNLLECQFGQDSEDGSESDDGITVDCRYDKSESAAASPTTEDFVNSKAVPVLPGVHNDSDLDSDASTVFAPTENSKMLDESDDNLETASNASDPAASDDIEESFESNSTVNADHSHSAPAATTQNTTSKYKKKKRAKKKKTAAPPSNIETESHPGFDPESQTRQEIKEVIRELSEIKTKINRAKLKEKTDKETSQRTGKPAPGLNLEQGENARLRKESESLPRKLRLHSPHEIAITDGELFEFAMKCKLLFGRWSQRNRGQLEEECHQNMVDILRSNSSRSWFLGELKSFRPGDGTICSCFLMTYFKSDVWTSSSDPSESFKLRCQRFRGIFTALFKSSEADNRFGEGEFSSQLPKSLRSRMLQLDLKLMRPETQRKSD